MISNLLDPHPVDRAFAVLGWLLLLLVLAGGVAWATVLFLCEVAP